MKKTNRSVVFMLVVIVSMFAIIANCGGNKKEQSREDIIPVKTGNVVQKELPIPIFTSGQLFPKSMVKLSFKTGGIIGKLYVEEGQTVRKNQLLAILDLSEIDARYKQAKNAWMKAERDLKRVENLYKDKAATLEQRQDVQTAFEIAASNLNIAQFNLRHSRITAPANGKIMKRLVETGEMIGAGIPVFVFGSTENNWVIKAGVSERDIVRLNDGDKAEIRFDAYPDRRFISSVTEISNAIDSTSGTYEVELTLDKGSSDGLKLAAGFIGKARIEPSSRKTYFVIPVDAIVEGEGSRGIVFTVKENKAVKLYVTVAHIFPETAAISAGLENIPRVVTAGAAYLRDGSKVKISGQ